jgi:hypothetical protein
MTDEIKRMDSDTEQDANPGAAVEDQGVGNHPTDPTDTDQYEDPKSGGTPVHPAPTADSQSDDSDADDSES